MEDRDTGDFWMVWNPQGRAPTARHATEELAEQEAHRLARVAPGEVFIVMKALYGCRMWRPAPPHVDRVPLAQLDLIPF